jgi:hypothetical protein
MRPIDKMLQEELEKELNECAGILALGLFAIIAITLYVCC